MIIAYFYALNGNVYNNSRNQFYTSLYILNQIIQVETIFFFLRIIMINLISEQRGHAVPTGCGDKDA